MITRTVLLVALLAAGPALSHLYAGGRLPALPLAPGAEPLPTIFDQMQRDGVVAIKLTTDLTALEGNRKNETYQAAEISYEVPGQGLVTRPMGLRVRGKYRRRVCSFPPLKLKFGEEILREAGLLPRHRTMKLVTHCVDDPTVGNENVLKEYLVYQLYREITETGYRVQLARVTYVDSQGKRPSVERYAFLIEDTDEMAIRIGGEECNECYNPRMEELRSKEATLMWLFQFMIGNADWNMPMMRNLKRVSMPGDTGDILVPYDFDFSGLVNTAYAKPNREEGLTGVRDRTYMGYETEDAVLQWAINYIKFKKQSLLKQVRDFDHLRRKSRLDIANYLEGFFRFLEDLNVNQATGIYERLDQVLLKYSANTGRTRVESIEAGD